MQSRWSRILAIATTIPFSKPALRVSERRLLLMGMDVVCLVASAILAMVVWARFRTDIVFTGVFVRQHIGWLAGLPVIWFILFQVNGLYELQSSARVRTTIRRLSVVILEFTALYILLYYLLTPTAGSSQILDSLGLPRLLRVVPIWFVIFSWLFLAGWRALYANLLTGDHFRRRTIIVGTDLPGQAILNTLRNLASGEYTVLGFVTTEGEGSLNSADTVFDDVSVLGTFEQLPALVRQHEANEIVVATDHSPAPSLAKVLLHCYEKGTEIVEMPTLYEQLTGRLPVQYLGPRLSFLLPEPPATWPLYRIWRRLFELCSVVVGLPLVVMLIPIVALCNRMWAPGPLFYRQERVGQGGRVFRLLKFRTMATDAEDKTGAVWAKKDDPRVTRVGNRLRKARIDELPQFWNVLKGEMSLIGPRPERPEFTSQLEHKIPFYRARHAVKPGLTGWAQVNRGYSSSVDSSLEKLEYDLYYIKHQGIALDFLITLRTISVVLTLKGT